MLFHPSPEGLDPAGRRPSGGWPGGLHRGLPLLMWLLLASYLIGLANHSGTDFEPLVDGWLGLLTTVVPAIVCWSAVRTAGQRRREVTCLAVGVSIWAVGATLIVSAAWAGVLLPFPSPADLAYLSFYPAMLAALVLAAHREHRDLRGAVWLDSALGALAAAAALAVLLAPLFSQASGRPLEIAVAVAYPAFDLLLVAVVVGIVALQGSSLPRHWVPLLTGLLLFAAADVVYALRVNADNFVLGTPVDVLWAAGLALMSVWARCGSPAGRPDQVRAEQPVALAVPALATITGLGVLIAASRTDVSALALALATATSLVAVLRTQLAFQQLRRLAEFRRQAGTDDLTGLPNRRAFSRLANAALDASDRPHALLLLDLDRFKEVNDSLGHQAGDAMLVQVGARFAAQLRDGDTIGRLGGDEFAVLVQGCDAAQAVAVAVKLRGCLREPFLVGGVAVSSDVSIGVSLAPEHGSELTGLLRRADIAMYKAKTARGGHRVFTSADDRDAAGRLRTLQEIRTALTEDQLSLHYQPKLTLGTDQVDGVEALVRWNHPTRGMLYPDSFLTLAEEAGQMPALTRLVLTSALDQAATWRAAGRPLTVAVNLSASSLTDTELPEQISGLLTSRGLPASALQLEITEDFLMADRERARDILQRLRDRGIQIAVDDFGTGYSSLAYLRDLPIDELKLDRSFVFGMADDARAAALVVSTIGLAHSLGLRMVAEGVESRTALVELARHSCDQVQGFYLSRPLPAVELELWLDERSLSHLHTRLPG